MTSECGAVCSGSVQPALTEHAELPFELRCLEAALETALSVMAGETGALELHASPLLNRASQKVAQMLAAISSMQAQRPSRTV